MADSRVSDLTDMGEAPARNDELYIVDKSGTVDRKIQVEDLFSFFDIVTHESDVVTFEGDVVYNA